MRSGREGDNTFVWLAGDEGTVGVGAAVDTILDFYIDRSLRHADDFGHDTIDLRDLLIGEENGDLTDYLYFSRTGSIQTTINVSTTGNLQPGGSGYDQQIKVSGQDITGGFTTQQDIIDYLINNKTLSVDQ